MRYSWYKRRVCLKMFTILINVYIGYNYTRLVCKIIYLPVCVTKWKKTKPIKSYKWQILYKI